MNKTEIYILVGMLGFLVLLPLMVNFDSYYLYVLTMAFLFAWLSLSWNILAYCGQISFGHAAFFGLGAYTSALLSLRLGFTPWLTVPVGGFLAIFASFILGGSCLQLKGPYLSLATLAFAEILRVITQNWTSLTAGTLGLVGIPPFPPLSIGRLTLDFPGNRLPHYYLLLTLLVLLIIGVAVLLRSPLGYAFSAIREGEARAEALGVNTFRYKLLALSLSAFFTGLGGGLYVHQIHYLEPGIAYSLSLSVLPLVMAMFGGRLTVIGPIYGAFILYLVNELIFQRLFPFAHQLLYAAVIVVVILFMPQGLAGWWRGAKGY